ncbi:UNVERIFIED_ORG: hypothetical protein J2R69_007672 [Bradyrhizobium japonicum]
MSGVPSMKTMRAPISSFGLCSTLSLWSSFQARTTPASVLWSAIPIAGMPSLLA